MRSFCYFAFNHSVPVCPNLYSTNLYNSLRTCPILVLVLSTLFHDVFMSLIHGFSAAIVLSHINLLHGQRIENTYYCRRVYSSVA
jgi:hypothetical protein